MCSVRGKYGGKKRKNPRLVQDFQPGVKGRTCEGAMQPSSGGSFCQGWLFRILRGFALRVAGRACVLLPHDDESINPQLIGYQLKVAPTKAPCMMKLPKASCEAIPSRSWKL